MASGKNVVTYLFDSFLIDNHSVKLCIFPILFLNALGLSQESPLIPSPFFFAQTIACPAAPSRQSVVNNLLVLVVNRLPLLSLKIADDVSPSECSLDQFLVSDCKR